ncbi:MAG TPA: glutamate racemase [Terracidiphilus sp.]|nr:glutamate racemase [Terracidiphilus sp.]
MTQPESSTPTNDTPTIGVFDSGFGGLTVLRALLARMPRARFVFLGDTARLPYGSKSRRTIARYAAESAQFLVREQRAEFLVIACNTASALALDAIQAAVPVPVLGVIQPGAAAARAASRTGEVLVIATDATVQSHAYSAACHALGLRTLEKACPLLVPLVEEGWTTDLYTSTRMGAPGASPLGTRESDTSLQIDAPQVAVTLEVIRIYLDELLADAKAHGLQPDTLVLGCTHYPLLRPLIQKALPPGIRVIDSADAAAEAAVHLFNGRAAPLASDSPSPESTAGAPAHIRCFATDSVEKFQRLGSRFLGRPVGQVGLVDLGG